MATPNAPNVPDVAHGRIKDVRTRLAGRDRYRWLVLVTLLFGVFAVGLSFTLLSVVIPTIEDEFGIDFSTAQWVVTGPILVFGVFGPVIGKLADLFGARRVFLLGFVGATIMFFLTAIAWNYESLLTFRLVGALEGASTAPAAIKIIATVFEPEERSKAIGWESFILAFSPAFGLLVGTAIVPAFGWRSVFLIQGVLCALACVVAYVILCDTPRSRSVRFDVGGAVTLAGGLFAALFALNRAEPWGFANPVVIAGFVLTPVLLASFVLIEARARDPLFPLHYFRRRNIWAGLSGAGLTNFAYLGGFLLAAPLLADVVGLSEGSRLMVLGIRPFTFAIVGAVAGYVVARTGERPMSTLGALGIAVGMFGLGAISAATPLWWIIAALVVTGAGMGLATPAFANAIVNTMELEDQGVAGGMVASVQAVGASAGTVVLVWLQQTSLESGRTVRGSFAIAYVAAAAVCVASAALASMIRSTVGRRARTGAAEVDAVAAASEA